MLQHPLAHLVGGLEVLHHQRGVGVVLAVVDQIVEIGEHRVRPPELPERAPAQPFRDRVCHECRKVVALLHAVRIRQFQFGQHFLVGAFLQRLAFLGGRGLAPGLFLGALRRRHGRLAAGPEIRLRAQWTASVRRGAR